MILIAHRGNVDGPSNKENTPSYIFRALEMGFDVEVDVWYRCGWYLGHDDPTYRVDLAYLETPGLWLHCKNYHALQGSLYAGLHCFYHTDEDYVLTSRGFIWTFPGMPGGDRTICVLPEKNKQETSGFAGVCSDWVGRYG
jgi:hypothetical protein